MMIVTMMMMMMLKHDTLTRGSADILTTAQFYLPQGTERVRTMNMPCSFADGQYFICWVLDWIEVLIPSFSTWYG